MPGPWELVIILVILLLLFGAKRLPGLARGLGKSVTNFKSAMHEEAKDEETEEKTKTS